MKYKDFEDFMQTMHMEDNPMLLDDDLPDHFGEWLGGLDGEEWLEYGQKYADIVACTCKQKEDIPGFEGTLKTLARLSIKPF
jgi:hypothetical protein